MTKLSQATRVIFNDSGNKVLPSLLRKGIFTVLVDDNIDQNSSSVDAKNHFHGTAVTVFQFPTSENPGLQRQRNKFFELIEDEKKCLDLCCAA